MYFIFLTILAYFIGSIPNALLVGLIFLKKDVRLYGSGNVGATNAARVLGKRLGLLTLILDILKGMIFVFIGKIIGLEPLYLSIIGFFAIIGHSYSIYLKFKGGKAVATTLGVSLILVPKVVLVLFFIFILITLITKYVSLASMVSAFLLPIFTYLLYNDFEYFILNILIAILIIYRHKRNILNLINGVEDKFSDKAKKK